MKPGVSYVLSLLVALLLFSAVFRVSQAQDHVSPAVPDEALSLIQQVRAATAKYHDLDTALEEGYGKFLECFQHGEGRGMGQHYVNGDLVGDAILDPLQPEAVVYEPLADGRMVMVAFEYIVFADVWDPNNEDREPPTLFGQEFSLKTNIPDTPPLWALHAWLWTHNPEGLFADFNPIVVCPADQPSIDFSMR